MPDVPSVWTVLSMMEWATDFFEEKKVRSPRFSIEWLLADVLSVKRLDLYMAYDRPLSKAELDTLRPMVKRRALHEPLQYITGETDFYHTTIKVKPGVLIPRQETEQLVELVLEQIQDRASMKVLDIGTGSGCIPVAVKKHRPEWKVWGTDISEQALQIAKENAALNEVDITFNLDDIFAPSCFPGHTKFDLIISNPPYILHEEKEGLDEEVKNHEPELALFCNSTEKMYGAIEAYASQHLAASGSVYLELHENHAAEVKELFSKKSWKTTLKKDYDQKDRFLIANR